MSTYGDTVDELLEKRVREFILRIMSDGTIPPDAIKYFTLLDWRNLGIAVKEFMKEVKK